MENRISDYCKNCKRHYTGDNAECAGKLRSCDDYDPIVTGMKKHNFNTYK